MSYDASAQWEYEVVSISDQLGDAAVKAALNELGAKGWELVGTHAGPAGCPRYVFKRQTASAGSAMGISTAGAAETMNGLLGLTGMSHVGAPEDEGDRTLRNVSMAEALMALPVEKQERLFAEILTEEERQMPSPPDDFYERVMLYFSMNKSDG